MGLVMVMGAYPALNFIPVAALAGIMLVVVLHTFKWFSVKMVLAQLLPDSLNSKLGLHRTVPAYEVLAIVLVTVLCNFPRGTNIAYAVLIGVSVSAVGFAWFAGNEFDVVVTHENNRKVYNVRGPLFFTFANRVQRLVTPSEDPDVVEIRFTYPTVM